MQQMCPLPARRCSAPDSICVCAVQHVLLEAGDPTRAMPAFDEAVKVAQAEFALKAKHALSTVSAAAVSVMCVSTAAT